MDPEPTAAEWLDRTVRITADGVYFGDVKLPGIIAEDGVTLTAGNPDEVNRLTVTFLVGQVHADDPVLTTDVTTPASTTTQYSSGINHG